VVFRLGRVDQPAAIATAAQAGFQHNQISGLLDGRALMVVEPLVRLLREGAAGSLRTVLPTVTATVLFSTAG
jgi:hypothetical protein